MKRLFSNKSGFTLIEIIVAFAIFAIMASMIMTMVRLTVAQRASNDDYAAEIEAQSLYLTEHFITDADKYLSTDPSTGNFISLDFSSANAGKIDIEYATRNTPLSYYNDYNTANKTDIDPIGYDEQYGINYFVGKGVDYNDSNDQPQPSDDPANSPLGNNQTSRVDTRLSGSKNLEYILINNVVKDTSYTVAGRSRYIIQCSAHGKSNENVGGTVPKEDVPYLQYRIRFADNNNTTTMDVTEDDGKTYVYDIPKDVAILDYGYVNLGGLSLGTATMDQITACFKSVKDHTPSKEDTNNRYKVEQTSSSIIRIAAPFGDTGGYDLDGAKLTTFYVVLDGDPQLTAASFGSNATAYTTTGYKYTTFPVIDEAGKTYSNIYGAYEYNKTEKTG